VTAVILVIIGIFIGRFLFNSSPIRVEDFASTKSPNSFSQAISTQTMITLQQMDRFLDRSRVILMAIENFDPETESTHAINLPYQKEISRQLVNQAVALKIDLSKTRQRRLKELLGELEVILMQIANIDSGSEMETLQLVKGGRYIRGILYKIRLIDLQRSKYITSKNRSI
jgi:Na+-transporting NADH:ubiquinone oxidoreductase subunit NqrC